MTKLHVLAACCAIALACGSRDNHDDVGDPPPSDPIPDVHVEPPDAPHDDPDVAESDVADVLVDAAGCGPADSVSPPECQCDINSQSFLDCCSRWCCHSSRGEVYTCSERDGSWDVLWGYRCSSRPLPGDAWVNVDAVPFVECADLWADFDPNGWAFDDNVGVAPPPVSDFE